MNQIVRKAYAKINLGLDVIRRKENGYHEVAMIMQTVSIYDTLTFEKGKTAGISITVDKQELPTDKNNLIYKAADLLCERYQLQEGIHISLQKNIPIAAGMAGGSTDAAAVFHGMNELFDLKMSMEDMQKLGVKIGADVPYCIQAGTALAEGIGEILTKLPAMPTCYLVIAKPDISVSTRYVYENLHANSLKEHPDIPGMTQAVRTGDLDGVIARMENVLETVTIKEYPIISQIKEFMLAHQADGALMSGSGPTVFGVWKDKEAAHEAYLALQQTNMAKQLFEAEPVNV